MECVTYLRISKSDIARERIQAESVIFDDVYNNNNSADSIRNQRKLLEQYIHKKGLLQVGEFVDEGCSGTNFNRPGFINMLEWIDKNNVSCIIVKDLSRLGRDYIGMGRLLEYYFPMKNIRVISVADGYDSERADYHERKITIPILNLLNDSYARDISCKVRYSQKVKRESGKYIGAFAVYGYKKADSDRNRLVIDDVAAKVVRRIFELRIAGYSAERIVKIFNEEKILSPYMYKKMNKSSYQTSFKGSETTLWQPYTVRRILKNEIYTGILIQGKTKKINYKIDKRLKLDEEAWVRCEGAVPAIISKRQFFDANKTALHRGLPRG